MCWEDLVEETRKKAEYRSSLRSKALIKRALLELMQEKKFEKITVSDIVRVADINRGTFYAHFKSTRDVFNKIQENMFTDLLGTLETFPVDFVISNPRPVLEAASNFLLADITYYKMLFNISDTPEFINRNKSKLFTYFLDSSAARKMEEAGHGGEFVAILDFWISATLTLYIDSILGRIPLTIGQLPDFCSKIMSLSTVTWLEVFQNTSHLS